VRADDGSNHHIVGDVRDYLADGWDLMAVMHPPCTRLCGSGVRWLYIGGRRVNGPDPRGWADLDEACAFYRTLPIPHCPQGDRKPRDAPPCAGQDPAAPRNCPTVVVWRPVFKATGLELGSTFPVGGHQPIDPPKAGTADHKAWSKIIARRPAPIARGCAADVSRPGRAGPDGRLCE
jgi:hypothetical protein